MCLPFPGVGRRGKIVPKCWCHRPDNGLGRGCGREMAMRAGAAGPGGPRDPGSASTSRRVVDHKSNETRLHDVRDVQHLARLVTDQTVKVAEQVIDV